jgi:6-phosphofructokinase 1
MNGKLAILVGGGPAPGINSVIGAATIRSALQGVEVLGIPDGFEELMQGKIDHVRPLTIDDVSRIHFRGGSILGTSRANPTKDPKHLDAVVDALARLKVTRLITIGGDDTAFSASRCRCARATSCASSTCPRRSTTTSTFLPTSIRSASRPRGTWAPSW